MRKTLAILLLLSLSTLLFATDWTPVITGVHPDGESVIITFNLDTSADGAKKSEVTLSGQTGTAIETKKLGKSKKLEKRVTLPMEKSGKYRITVTAFRDEEQKEATQEFEFLLPLRTPVPEARNIGSCSLSLSWDAVPEATGYEVSLDGGKPVTTTGTELTFASLPDGKVCHFTVTALRNRERVSSSPLKKTARKEADRVWTFTEFGQSTKPTLNTFTMRDSDDLSFTLESCTFSSDGTIRDKGGKFTSFHDGISFYYTVIDPNVENFNLTATFHIDYINPTADGQEGFGLLAMDSLGEEGVSASNHYTNSAGIISTKFEETIGGTKKTSKDTLGARFVTNLTREAIEGGDEAIAKEGVCTAHAFSYDQSDLTRKGDVCTLTLKKDNTGYHAILKQKIASEDTIEEYVLYDASALSVLDKEHVYVGFAVARGCNATISDVSFTTTKCADDAPAEEAPPTLVPIQAKIDSPTTYSNESYPFTYIANCDGALSVKIHNGKTIIDKAPIQADTDFTKTITLRKGINDYEVTFTPKAGWKPEAHSVMARYNKETKRYEMNYGTISTSMTVIYLDYQGENLYASSTGSPFGDGSKADPLDLPSALAYCKPGQSVIILDTVLHPSRPLIIERGNDGTETARKTLTSETRTILDFSASSGGMELWGSYWTIENIDITGTPDNKKGLQIAGNHNIIRNVNAYNNGDTGIQISGTSTETYPKWPHDNLIEGCVSHDNRDSAENNADGFAAKLTVAGGNVFRSCIAHHNIDDGWDLFSKIESGPIGEVTIEDCVACWNGSLSDGSGSGDGNGFKLGGDGIAVPHLLKNSLAYKNNAGGVTSNSNPAVRLDHVTSVANEGSNFSLYGKGSGERLFMVSGCLSIDAPDTDKIEEVPHIDDSNYFSNGAVTSNGKLEMDNTIFTKKDVSMIPEVIDGEIVTHGLFDQTTEAGCHF